MVDVVIADKNPLVLSGLRQLFADDPRFTVAFTASDGERFLEAVERRRPDVGIIGWVMPYCHGRDVLRALRDYEDAPRVVVYSGIPDVAVPQEVMQLGGAAFYSKSEPPEALLDVVWAVAAGRMVFPFLDVRRLREDPLHRLSPREQQLLHALGSGRTNAQLACDLGVSPNTIKFHLKNLYDKLSVRSRAQAVALLMSTHRGDAYPAG